MLQGRTEFLGDLSLWLAKTASGNIELDDVFLEFCDWLKAHGLQIARASLGLEMLHPQLTGRQVIWSARHVRVISAERGNQAEAEYQNSPARVIDETRRMFRRRLDSAQADFPMLETLRRSGATDYVIFPLPFLDHDRTNFASFATERDGGFGAEELELLEHAVNAFSPLVERHVLRMMALDLLSTYVGPRTGQRIYDGTIERGQGEIIRAIIMIADLRGYTRYADTHPLDIILRDLNQWFELMVSAITANGGEVLKFTGDGILAIFPISEDNFIEASQLSIAAAQSAINAVSHINTQRDAAGQGPFQFGMGLDAGEIAYGNIGSPARLDFTVIGSSVNRASRLVELSKKLDVTVLMSHAFAEPAAELGLRNLGRHILRDLGTPRTLFTLR